MALFFKINQKLPSSQINLIFFQKKYFHHTYLSLDNLNLKIKKNKKFRFALIKKYCRPKETKIKITSNQSIKLLQPF